MKKLKLIFLLVLFGLTICISAQKDKNSDETTDVVILDKAGFLSKVYNYKNNPDKWVYEGELPCIIDFYADWCGPCRKVSPILKELAKEYRGKIVVYKIDVDKEHELASYFQVQSIPAYLFIPTAGDPQSSVGALPREFFIKVINDFLLKTGNKNNNI